MCESQKFTATKLASYIKEVAFPLNVILIGVGAELRNVFDEMNTIVNAAPRGKYIPIYSERNLAKLIDEAFTTVKEIMAASEIEGFTPEEH